MFVPHTQALENIQLFAIIQSDMPGRGNTTSNFPSQLALITGSDA